MKNSFKCMIIVAIGLGAFFLSASGTNAQQPEPVPVIISATAGQYKVIDIGKISVGHGLTAASTLEAILNDLGAQGWKVVAATGSLIILGR